MELAKRIQFGVLVLEILEHLAVGRAELVHIGLAGGRAGELDVGAGAVGADVEALLLQQRVRLHAAVLVAGAHHGMAQLHEPLSPIGPRVQCQLSLPLAPREPPLPCNSRPRSLTNP
jgi:hypothetical protein